MSSFDQIKKRLNPELESENESPDWEDKAIEYAGKALEKAEPVLKVLGYPGGLVRGGIAGLAEAATGRDDLVDIKDVLKGNSPSTSELLEKLGVGEMGSLSDIAPSLYSETGKGLPLKKGGILDITGRGALGFAGDVATDPLTYLAGAGLASKGAEAAEESTGTFKALKDRLKETMADETGAFNWGKKPKPEPKPESEPIKAKVLNLNPTEILPGIYSKAEKTILDRMGRSAKPEQIYSEIPLVSEDGTPVLTKDGKPKVAVGGLLHSAQVKPEEIQFLKIPEFLKGKDTVTKEELLEHIRQNLPELNITEFDKFHSMGSHYIPGKTSFKGIQYDARLPKEIQEQIFDQLKSYDPEIKRILEDAKILNLEQVKNDPSLVKILRDHYEKKLDDFYTEMGAKAADMSPLPTYAAIDSPSGGDLEKIRLKLFANLFRDTSHYGESPNIVGHYRNKLTSPDYPGQEGPALSAHEIQSQWHHKGAQQGYLSEDETIKAEILNKRLTELREKEEEFQKPWRLIRKQIQNLFDQNGIDETKFYDDLAKIRDQHNNEYSKYINDPEYKKIRNEHEARIRSVTNTEEYKKLKKEEDNWWEKIISFQRDSIYPVRDELEKIQGGLSSYEKKMPYAPFKGDAIYELLAKLQLLDAAKADAGRIIWPTAKTQAKRYQTGSQAGNLNRVEIIKNAKGNYEVTGFNPRQIEPIEFILNPQNKPYTDANIDVVLPKELQSYIKSAEPEVDAAGNKKWVIESDNNDLYLGAKRFRKIYDDIQTKLYRNIGQPYKQEPYLHLEPGAPQNDRFTHSPDYNMILTPEMKKDLLTKGLPLWLVPFLMNQGQDEDVKEDKFNKLNQYLKRNSSSRDEL